MAFEASGMSAHTGAPALMGYYLAGSRAEGRSGSRELT